MRILFFVLPIVFGTILPFLTPGSMPQIVNVPWGLIFGFGFYPSLLFPIFLFPGSLIGAWAWPVLVGVLLFYFTRDIWDDRRKRGWYVTIVTLSLCIDIPAHTAGTWTKYYVLLYPVVLGAH